jgi:amino acid permease
MTRRGWELMASALGFAIFSVWLMLYGSESESRVRCAVAQALVAIFAALFFYGCGRVDEMEWHEQRAAEEWKRHHPEEEARKT